MKATRAGRAEVREIRVTTLGFSRAFAGLAAYDGSTSKPPEMPMKELTMDEVLRIAGGLPVPAALDEVTYLAPSAADPIDYARLLEPAPRTPEAA